MEKVLSRAEMPETLRYDVLLVDEGQDFLIVWRDILLRHAEGWLPSDLVR
jgi:hypothetical protein